MAHAESSGLGRLPAVETEFSQEVIGLARASLPATCGELVQGSLDGVPCLVSCPIDYYSTAHVRLKPDLDWEIPPGVPKTATALRACLSYLGAAALGGKLELLTDVPRGRGYGSSTADIGAVLYALAQAAGRLMSPEQVACLAVDVEPTDSTVFPGLTLFEHRGARFYECLGPAPALRVVVIDPGGEVDTLAFNRINHREALHRLAAEHEQAFDLLRQGLKGGDWRAVGEAATLSARVHQTILPNPLLDPVLALAREVGALGVCRAHSGTLLGLLVDSRYVDLAETEAYITCRLPDSVAIATYPLVDGGPRYIASVNQLPQNSKAEMGPAMVR